jgi:hypothetical protein
MAQSGNGLAGVGDEGVDMELVVHMLASGTLGSDCSTRGDCGATLGAGCSTRGTGEEAVIHWLA